MSVLPVSEQPNIELAHWSICLDGVGEIRLLGSPIGTSRMRISSPLVAFDPVDRVARTMSGREYRLIGGPDPVFAALCATIWFRGFPLTPQDVTWLLPDQVPEHLTPPSPSAMRH